MESAMQECVEAAMVEICKCLRVPDRERAKPRKRLRPLLLKTVDLCRQLTLNNPESIGRWGNRSALLTPVAASLPSLFAGPCFIDLDLAAIEFLAIEGFDGVNHR